MATIIRLHGDGGVGLKVQQDVNTVLDLWRSSRDARPLGLSSESGKEVYVSPAAIAAVYEVGSGDAGDDPREQLSRLRPAVGRGPASAPRIR